MGDFLPFVVAGLTLGSIYGLAGMGLVLTYKTSGVFNFAYGSLSSIAAYACYALHVQAHLPWVVAIVIPIAIVGAGLGVAMQRVGRALARTPLTVQVAATVGILVAIEGIA